jgi:hypothetical protein
MRRKGSRRTAGQPQVPLWADFRNTFVELFRGRFYPIFGVRFEHGKAGL